MISNQHIVKEPSGQQWRFFFQPTNGICYSKKQEGHWTSYEILFKDGLGDFDVIVDKKNMIYLACQDKLGSIIYLIYNGKQWYKYVILQSKTGKAYPKYFKLILINEHMNLFYILENQSKNLLIHHMLDGDNNIRPSVIDNIAKSARPFCASKDSSNNIYIVYNSGNNTKNVGYKVYYWSQKAWSDFISIDHEKADTYLPYFIIDEDENIHLIYLNKTEKSYSILYRRRSSSIYNKAVWDKEIEIPARLDHEILPVIMKANKNLLILWQQDIKILSCSSDNGGITWNKPSQFQAGKYGDICLIGCRASDLLTSQGVICDQCYAYKNANGITLYMIADYLEKQNPIAPKPEYQLEGHEIEEFAKKSIAKEIPAEEKMNKPDISNDNIELTKLKIMQNMLREEVNQIRKKMLETTQDYKNDELSTKTLMHQNQLQFDLINEQICQLNKQIEIIKEIQNKIITDFEKLEKDIIALKRQNHQTRFEDLMNTNE